MLRETSNSSPKLITLFTKKYRQPPILTLMGESNLVNTEKKILGVNIDYGWDFRQQTQDNIAIVKSRSNAMDALSSTIFGFSKIFLTALYKQFCSLHSFLCQHYLAFLLAQSHLQILQRTLHYM